MHYINNQNFKELELLLQDVRLHPTRYVNVSLGKKEKPYKAPGGYYLKEKTSDYELFR
jgi:phospholipid/cholesterol/gamma-HCH transport system substrate-binding protein